jgi:hypothetical protein
LQIAELIVGLSDWRLGPLCGGGDQSDNQSSIDHSAINQQSRQSSNQFRNPQSAIRNVI